MIEVDGLTKRSGPALAVDALSFTVQPGRVTGFLGPNGAGKSTTMRLTLGLDRPTAGDCRILGRRHDQHRFALHDVGALLDAGAVHGGRTASSQLLSFAQASRIPRSRVREVLDLGRTGHGRAAPGARILSRHEATPRYRRRAAG